MATRSETPPILLTVDGSDKDERAIAVAAALAELADATVRVVRVFDSPTNALPARTARLGAVDTTRSVRADVVESVRRSAEQLGAIVPGTISWDVIDGLDVATTLLEDLEMHAATLVVMATRAAGAVDRAIQGSVADRLARESPRPVVLVPPRADYMSGKHVVLRRVLVPLDGSSAALRVIPTLLELARAEALELVLLQVVAPGRTPPVGDEVPSGSEWTDAGPVVAQQRLGTVAERLRAGGSQVEVRVIESADVGPVIVDAIRSDLVELIAMSTRGASGLRRLVLGSVAEHVVRHCEVPVLLVTARSRGAVSDAPVATVAS